MTETRTYSVCWGFDDEKNRQEEINSEIKQAQLDISRCWYDNHYWLYLDLVLGDTNMRAGVILKILASILLLAVSAQGASINMNEKEEPKKIDVQIEDLHYTVTMDQQIITKIELAKADNADLNITTTWDQMFTFIKQYDDMTWMQRIKYAMDNFGISAEYMLNIVN